MFKFINKIKSFFFGEKPPEKESPCRPAVCDFNGCGREITHCLEYHNIHIHVSYWCQYHAPTGSRNMEDCINDLMLEGQKYNVQNPKAKYKDI